MVLNFDDIKFFVQEALDDKVEVNVRMGLELGLVSCLVMVEIDDEFIGKILKGKHKIDFLIANVRYDTAVHFDKVRQ